MMNIDERISKILGYKTWSDRRKIDALLEMDADLYCNLGTESLVKEKNEAKKNSRKIYKAITEINRIQGLTYLQYLKDYSE
jgi:hypothetical protein